MTWDLLLKGGGFYFVVADYLLLGLIGWLAIDLVFRRLKPGRVDALHRILDMGIALCPFLGLAGTVWEISGVLIEMGGGVTGVALAAPLGSALRYTFHGIVAASLCLVGSGLTGALQRRFAEGKDVA
jgi:hypothetical protein